jgi:small-conductance mechanosensitive channel
MSNLPPGSRTTRNLTCIVLLATCFLHLSAPARAATNPAVTGVTLKVLNREVMTFRANLGTYSPEQRAEAAEVRIEKALKKNGTPRVDSQMVDGNAELRVRGQTVFFVLPKDINELEGETLHSVVQNTVSRLDQAVAEAEELRNHQSLLKSVALGIGTTFGLGAFIWLLARNRRWVEARLIRLTAGRADQIKLHSLRVFGLQNLVGMLRGLMTAVFWAATIIAAFLWLEFLLRLFPSTRPFGEQLGEKFLLTLGKLGQGALHALPNLGIVILVLALARFAATAARRFFAAVAMGNSQSRFFDQTTAPIAQRLSVILIWTTAVIVAFPYIPGSQTPAFRGISVLAGLMISLGSGSLISQLVGGLVMVYNRACRPGDFVRIGEYEGTIASVGFFSSRLVTGRNEEIVLPNSQISSSALINYTRLNETDGVLVPAAVTIGYNTPWRQVHAMLLEAARRTTGTKPRPEPIVLQKQLSDFYVEYELRVALETPSRRASTISQLHAHIQDVFNEYGVQIMSPHYEADTAAPVVVPKAQWHEPPATQPE